jgi:DNA repair and recombination RAD54-like protein
MSDEEEDAEDNEEEEEEEEEGDEEEEEEQNKEELVKADIAIIKDIFAYIDQTSKRITTKFNIEREINMRTAQNLRKEQLERHENPDLSYAQYENLDEGQRAELLEKAIMILAQDS